MVTDAGMPVAASETCAAGPAILMKAAFSADGLLFVLAFATGFAWAMNISPVMRLILWLSLLSATTIV
jgi:hypothetical protein